MTHLQEFDEAVRLLAEAGRSRDQIAKELDCTYWKVRKAIVRLGIPVAEGKRGRQRTRRVGDPDYTAELQRSMENRRRRRAEIAKDPIARKQQEILEAEKRRLAGLPPVEKVEPEPVESIWG